MSVNLKFNTASNKSYSHGLGKRLDFQAMEDGARPPICDEGLGTRDETHPQNMAVCDTYLFFRERNLPWVTTPRPAL